MATDDPAELKTAGADDAVERLYAQHWASLVRLGALLVRDRETAEDVTQDAFVSLHGRWDRLREHDKALAYLRRSVVNGCHSAGRRTAVAARHQPDPLPDVTSAEVSALATERRSEVLAALATLPRRQREVLVLRHWLDLSEAEIATTLRISRGSVKSHSSRGLKSLRTTLERTA
ncbi:SigE family RNA polymerase sigma factor [soil metagenome]